MNTADIVAKLTDDSMANSYLMTYMAASREVLRQYGLEITPEIAPQLQALEKVDVNTLPDDPSNPALAIAKVMREPEFEAAMKETYKAKMLEVLAQLEIELTPEVISEFKRVVGENPPGFAGMFASVL